MDKIRNIVFDFGGVLIDWNPRYLYRKVFREEAEMENFLSEVCNGEWNEKQDGGRPFSEGISELTAKFPDKCKEIALYYDCWDEMIGGGVDGSIEILYALKSLNYRLYGLTNWSGETFPKTRERFAFLNELDGIVVSGDEKLLKPDPEFFKVLIGRYDLSPDESVFIDDNIANVEAGRRLGFRVIRFESAGQLKSELEHLGVLPVNM